MTPVIPYSISNVSLIPGTVFTTRKNYSSTRFSLSRKTTINTSCPQIFLLSRSASFRLLPPYGRECSLHNQSRIHLLRATGADVAVEEPDSPVAGEDSGEATAEVKSDATPAPAQSKRSRPVNKSKMPRVKNEELVAGAIFTGKVMTIQPFGAFVDFGAFTDGLIHVSQLTGSFVKDVSSVVSVGQEVKVRLIEANMKTGRISLSMCEGDNSGKGQQQKESSGGYERGGPGRRNASKSGQRKDEPKKVSKFVKGQDLEGTVKNMNRAGAFITLPEGEEGFLPISEELGDGFRTMMGETTLEVGQEVSVRVLRISRGQVTLTMKKEEDIQKMEIQVGQGVVHTATNPFLLAFRKNKDIAAFLDEREKEEKAAEKPVVPTVSEEPEKEVVSESVSDCPEGQNQPVISNEVTIDVPSAADEKLETDEASSESAQLEASALEEPATDISESKEEPDTSILSTAGSIDAEVQTTEETEVSAEIENAEASVSAEEAIAKEASSVDAEESNGIAELADQRVSSESSTVDVVAEQEAKDATVKDEPSVKENKDPLIKDEVAEQQSDDATIKDELPVQEANDATVKNEVAEQQTDDATVKQQSDDAIVKDELPVQEANDATYKNEVAEQQADDATVKDEVAEQQAEDATVKDEVAEQEAEDATVKDELPVQQSEDATVKDELPVETPPAENEDSSSTPTENGATPNSDNNGSVGNSGVQPDNAPSQAAKATISPALVKQLREETGAGMMDCKKALSESGGDIVKAQEYLRKKGLASAEKKASRATAEGRIGSYIHDSRIGVLVEVNCETDFVSRGEIFKELVDDLAMQVVACPQVHYVVTEDVPKEIVNKEQEIEMQKEDLLSKPEQIRLKIVEGRIKKRLDELALLEQPYIKNDKVLIKDWVKQTIATIGENINVKRFVRYNLGEGLEKKSQDFAAEVAAQTSTKLVPKEQPAAVPEANETVEKPPTVAVSATLVKQLREETGAGMMDCKKALSETGGDIEKAQEYLRKKGLSSAEKKSSRLAAEGRIGSYIHDSRIGVLIEVNCETDFVGRSEKFKELVDDLAMQAVACPQVQFVSIEDIGEEIVKKEKEIEMQRDDLQSKPENIREKIVEGRVSKRLGELALLEQPFIKNDSILVKDLVKQTVAALGENIKVRRFVRFTLGETAAGDAKAESKT